MLNAANLALVAFGQRHGTTEVRLWYSS